MDLTAVIVSWRAPEALRACLRSLESDPFPGSREVWVVDNSPGDGAAEMVRAEFPKANLLSNAVNVGFPRAVNQALEKAAGRVVLLLNPDARLAPGACKTAVDYLDANPTVGVLGAAIFDEAGVEQPETHRPFPSLWTEFCELTTLWRRFPDSPLLNPWRTPGFRAGGPVDVPCVSGACAFVRREALDAQGGLDATCPLYLEDLELCRRAAESGRRVVHHPGVRATHTGGVSAAKASAYVRALNYRARYVFFRRRYGRFQAELLRAMVAAAMAARLAAGAAGRLLGAGREKCYQGERRALRWSLTLDDAGWREIGG